MILTLSTGIVQLHKELNEYRENLPQVCSTTVIFQRVFLTILQSLLRLEEAHSAAKLKTTWKLHNVVRISSDERDQNSTHARLPNLRASYSSINFSAATDNSSRTASPAQAVAPIPDTRKPSVPSEASEGRVTRLRVAGPNAQRPDYFRSAHPWTQHQSTQLDSESYDTTTPSVTCTPALDGPISLPMSYSARPSKLRRRSDWESPTKNDGEDSDDDVWEPSMRRSHKRRRQTVQFGRH